MSCLSLSNISFFFTSNRCLSVVSLREISKCVREKRPVFQIESVKFYLLLYFRDKVLYMLSWLCKCSACCSSHRREAWKGSWDPHVSVRPLLPTSYMQFCPNWCGLREGLEVYRLGGPRKGASLMSVDLLSVDLPMWLLQGHADFLACSHIPIALKVSLINPLVLQTELWQNRTWFCQWNLSKEGRCVHLPLGKNFSNTC